MPRTPEAVQDTPDPRPPYGWAAAAATAVGALYALTLSPTTAFWDTSEYIATAHMLGIPHQPGNPLFVVLGRAWAILLEPFGLSTAVRINLFSALMSALAHGFWFLVAHHVLSRFSANPRFPLVGASASVLVSATAFTVWSQSNVNEKVYTVSLMTIALLSWLACLWRQRLHRSGDDNLLVLMAFVLALSVGNHLMAFLAAPALLIFVLYLRPHRLLNPKLYLFGIPAIVLGLSIHLFLPIRSELRPVINEAAPRCESVGGALASVVTYGNAGCEELSNALQRSQYDKPDLLPRLASLPSQYENWLQYFDWQWARSLSPTDTHFGQGRLAFTALFIALGVLGLVETYRRDRAGWLYLASLFGVLSVGLVFYLNFKYGFTIPGVPPGAEREVRERDYFFVVGFSVWGVVAGLGVASLWRRTAKGRPAIVAAPVLGLALLPLALNYGWADRSHDHSARDWAYNLLMGVEPYGLLFTNGDNDTFPLWYLQEVEGIRRDVTVAVTSYLNTDWYVRQLRDLSRPCGPGQDPDEDPTRILCQRPYTAENTDAMYTHDAGEAEAAGKTWIPLEEPVRAPTRSVFPPQMMDDAFVTRVATSLFPLGEGRTFDLGPIQATMAGGRDMIPWEQFALAAISNSLGDRPVYFASSGGTANRFGLRPHLIRQGLAHRLVPGYPGNLWSRGVRPQPDTELKSVIGDWVDVERTAKLVDEVFVHRGGLPDGWAHWPDVSTVGIPNYYAWVYYGLLFQAMQDGDAELQTLREKRALAWARLGAHPAEILQ